ncbi:MAG: hypothetical protein AB7L90_05280 [Hyphomicrobiaceae bacterium]
MTTNLQTAIANSTQVHPDSKDVGRDTGAPTDISLAAALREHAGRMARAEAIRYQIAMGLLGFIGGLAVIVPLVVLVAPRNASILPRATAAHVPAMSSQIVRANATDGPALVSVPTIAIREQVQDAPAPVEEPPAPSNPSQGAVSQGAGAAEMATASGQARSADDEPVELARNMIRSGDILAARRVLGRPDLSQSGRALFMLAETYDPNVLAALGATGVHAETSMARRFYEAALAAGVTAASPRLEALE